MRRAQGALIEIAHEIEEKNQFLQLEYTRYARRILIPVPVRGASGLRAHS
jgi:LytS/YehU family sensor histidine kinase